MKRLCLLVVCLAAAIEAQAQVPASGTDYHVSVAQDSTRATAPEPPPTTFRSGVDLVALNVVVTDGAEKFVSGLRRTSRPHR